MAKRASSAGAVNVSEAVRKYKSTHKRAKPKAISEALAADGIEVSPTYVSTILSNYRRKKGTSTKRGGRAAAAKRGNKYDNVLGELMAAKQLVEKMGGVEKAQAALAALAKLQ